jgi:hypothetical protein
LVCTPSSPERPPARLASRDWWLWILMWTIWNLGFRHNFGGFPYHPNVVLFGTERVYDMCMYHTIESTNILSLSLLGRTGGNSHRFQTVSRVAGRMRLVLYVAAFTVSVMFFN